MADKTTNPFLFPDWINSPGSYSDLMDLWWKNFAQSVPDSSQDIYQKIMDQGKTFYFLSEQFNQLLQGISTINQTSDEWQKYLNVQFDNLKKLYTDSDSDISKTMQGMFSAWQLLPMDTLQRTLSSSSLMPGDFMQDLKMNNFQDVTDKFLSVPGIGYTRESQEQLQEGVRLWNIYQQTSNEYIHALSKVGLDALESMRQKILEMAANGNVIHSLREIYDLWVDAHEKAYADFVYTDEYSELYGRMTNALMAVKKHNRNYIDEILASLNMPTRKGMNTMLKRQQEIRRENITARKKIRQLEKDQQKLFELLADKQKVESKDKSSGEKPETKTGQATPKSNIKKTAKSKTRKKKTPSKAGKKSTSVKKRESSKRNNGNDDNMIVIKI